MIDKLDTIFNSQDKEDIKKVIKETIIDQIKDEIKERNCYLLDTNCVQEYLKEALDEIGEEMKIEYRDVIKKHLKGLIKEDI